MVLSEGGVGPVVHVVVSMEIVDGWMEGRL